jgi:hypothetical protein
MAEETLLTAARRAVRNFNIVMSHGGLVDVEMQQTMDALDKMVRKETARQAAAATHDDVEAEVATK